MVLPIKADHISQLTLFDTSATDVYGNVFVLMAVLEELSDAVHGVAVELFNARSWEGHSDDTISNVG